MAIITLALLLLTVMALILAAFGHTQVATILLAVTLIVLLAVGNQGPALKL